jgi:hypothetical protein
MTKAARQLAFFFAAVLALACAMQAQDSPSLGDVARQTRQKKQQSTDGQNPDTAGKNSIVISNEDLPEHTESPSTSGEDDHGVSTEPSDVDAAKLPPEQWQAQILAQKSLISRLQSDTDKLNDSIQFAPGNCVAGCVQWNQHQEEKQRRVERMRHQLEEQKSRLQQMQDAARQQGYGSSVYDP